MVAFSFITLTLVGFLLRVGSPGDYPSLHSALDAGCALTAALIALSLRARVRAFTADLLDLIWVCFLVTACLEAVHTVVGFEWAEETTRIARPSTWPPPAHILPLGLVLALAVWSRGRRLSVQRFGWILTALAVSLLLVFSRVPPYSPPVWFGVTRPALILVPLLWIAAAVAAWRIRDRDRLGDGLLLLSVFLALASSSMLVSRAPHDAAAMAAHIGKLLGYLQFQVYIALLGSLDGAELAQVADTLARSESALRRSEARMRLACSAARLGAWEWQREGDLVECSEEVLRLWQIPVSHWPRNRAGCLQRVHPEDRGEVLRAIDLATRAGDSFHLECRVDLPGEDGRQAWVEVVGLLEVGPGGPVRAYGALQDITQRKRVETSLQQAEEYFRKVVDQSYDGFISIDSRGLVTGWNRQAEAMFGWTLRETLGQRLDGLIIPEGHRAAHLQGLRHYLATGEGPVLNRVTRLAALRRDGSTFPVELTISPLGEGDTTIFTAFLRDISDRVGWEEAQRRYASELEASNAELDAFSYSVSHDLRAPLRGIDGFSQVLLEDFSSRLDDEGRGLLARIRAASQRMSGLIDDLLHLSRVSRSELIRGPVDLSGLARSIAIDLAATAPDRSLEFVIAPGLSAEGDPRLLRIALENLLGNAWKYTTRHERAVVEFGTLQQNGTTVYYVRDDGAGFDMAYADKLFGAFQRLHGADQFEGSGIGLATVQRVIQRHGGRIWAEGAVERGATFFFTL